jgi:hypothetical protein
VDKAGVFANVQGIVGYKRPVGKERNKEDGIRDNPQGRKSVNMMLIEMSAYLRTIDKGGRGRNKRFGRWGLYVNRRRRSNRKRRVTLRSRRWRASEREGRRDKSWGDDVRDRSELRGGGGRNVGLNNQSRKDAFRIGRHFGE